MRTIATQEAFDAVHRMSSLGADLQQQLRRLEARAQLLSDPNVWDGPAAQQFRQKWTQMQAPLVTAVAQLAELIAQLERTKSSFLAAGAGDAATMTRATTPGESWPDTDLVGDTAQTTSAKMVIHLERLFAAASPEARQLAATLLEQEVADSAWSMQLGPALKEEDVASLLSESKEAIGHDAGMLRVSLRNGEPVYPIFQFDGRRQVPGLAEVVRLLAPVVATPLTIAGFLTGAHPQLEHRRPIDLLRSGDVGPVLDAASLFVSSALA